MQWLRIAYCFESPTGGRIWFVPSARRFVGQHIAGKVHAYTTAWLVVRGPFVPSGAPGLPSSEAGWCRAPTPGVGNSMRQGCAIL